MWTPGIDPTAAKNRRLHRAYEKIKKAHAVITPEERAKRERRAFDGDPDFEIATRREMEGGAS